MMLQKKKDYNPREDWPAKQEVSSPPSAPAVLRVPRPASPKPICLQSQLALELQSQVALFQRHFGCPLEKTLHTISRALFRSGVGMYLHCTP